MSDPREPSDSPDGGSWERDFERLREKYRIKLQQQIEALGASLERARESDARPELESARQLVHRMKGTSGSYGLDETCAALERIEAHLDTLLEAAPPDPASIWADVERWLQRARTGLG
jgi:HPt (histidine-containing phosphotransfer) domain-containing protein